MNIDYAIMIELRRKENMKVEYYKEYSHELGRDMEFKVYGHAGKPCGIG